ncbi:MAG: FlgD immunoglobulin-like domain containing protein [Thermoleophilia bacterium]
MSPPAPGGRGRRVAVAAAMLVLFVVALGVFLLPFAFPTPPPIVTRFQATQLFSPNSDGRRDVATIGVRLSEPSNVTIEIQQDGEPVITLLDDEARPTGFFTTEWDGLDSAGRRVPDGTYAIKLRARAGAKRFDTTRRVVIDTSAPRPAAMEVVSATLAGPGPGECRVSFASRDAASMTLEAVRPDGGGDPLRRLGPRPVRADEPVRWNWSGQTAGGELVEPGLYVIRASLFDAARNRVVRERTCWVGYMAGTASPSDPDPRDQVGASLRGTDGATISGATPVSLVLRRRTGVPGQTGGDPLGDQVGPGARGPAGRARVRIPAGVNPDALWLVVTRTDGEGSALVDLRGGG